MPKQHSLSNFIICEIFARNFLIFPRNSGIRSLCVCVCVCGRVADVRGGGSVHPGTVRGEEQKYDEGDLLSSDVRHWHHQHSVRLWRRHWRHYRQQPARLRSLLTPPPPAHTHTHTQTNKQTNKQTDRHMASLSCTADGRARHACLSVCAWRDVLHYVVVISRRWSNNADDLSSMTSHAVYDVIARCALAGGRDVAAVCKWTSTTGRWWPSAGSTVYTN